MSGNLIADGMAYVHEADALCERLGIASLSVYDGHAFALLLDGSEVVLADLLAKDARPEVERIGGNVTTIKPASRRTD
jgi:hypothetical protein